MAFHVVCASTHANCDIAESPAPENGTCIFGVAMQQYVLRTQYLAQMLERDAVLLSSMGGRAWEPRTRTKIQVALSPRAFAANPTGTNRSRKLMGEPVSRLSSAGRSVLGLQKVGMRACGPSASAWCNAAPVPTPLTLSYAS